MDFGSQWNITRRGTLKEDHPGKTNQKTRHGQFKRDHLERSTYQQIPKAYTKHNELTIQHTYWMICPREVVKTVGCLVIQVVWWSQADSQGLYSHSLPKLTRLIRTFVVDQSVGLFIGALVMDFKRSIVIAALYALTSMLLGGFYQKNIPSWLQWFQYLSYLTYSYEAALTTEFTTSPPFR